MISTEDDTSATRSPLRYAAHDRSLPRDESTADSCFAAAIAFAVSHMTCEYFAQFAVLRRFPPAGLKRGETLESQIGYNIFVESILIFFAAILVFLVQWILNYGLSTRRRKRVWIAAVVLGFFYCLIKWGLWGLGQAFLFNYSEGADLFVSMSLAAVAGLLLAIWRQQTFRFFPNC